MWENTRRILPTLAPATNMAKLKSKFPAGYLPNTNGGLYHLKGFLPEFLQPLQTCTTVTIVPFFVISISGFSSLQLKQNIENRDTKHERKTMKFVSPWGETSESTLQDIKKTYQGENETM